MKILIVSDIHANWPALSAVVTAEPYERLICLGDVVDYGPHPRPCLDYIRQHAAWVVRGNHDNALGSDLDCGCRGDFRELSVSTRAWHRTLVQEDDRSEEHTSELQSLAYLVCRLLLEKKKKMKNIKIKS